jgi:uncharacterized membrane protein
MADPMPVAPVPPARWLKLAFFLSLALNLATLGVVGGAMLHGPRDQMRPMGRDLGFGPFTEALSPEDREALARAFRDRGGSQRDIRRDFRAEFGNLLTALRADPFDPDQIRGVFERMQLRGQERMQLGQQLLADRILNMSSDARARFADRLEEQMSRIPMHGTLRDKGN